MDGFKDEKDDKKATDEEKKKTKFYIENYAKLGYVGKNYPVDEEDKSNFFIFALCSDHRIRKWRMPKGEMVDIIEINCVGSLYTYEVFYYANDDYSKEWIACIGDSLYVFDLTKRIAYNEIQFDSNQEPSTSRNRIAIDIENNKCYIGLEKSIVKEFDVATGKVRIFDDFSKRKEDISSISYMNKHLYIISDISGPIYQLDLSNGKLVKKIPLPKTFSGKYVSDIVAHNNTLYCYGHSGAMLCMNANDNAVKWTSKRSGDSFEIINDDKIYTLDSDVLKIIDNTSGFNVTTVNLIDYYNPLLVHNNVIYTYSSGRSTPQFKYFHVENNEIAWKVRFQESCEMKQVQIVGNRILIRNDNNRIKQINLYTPYLQDTDIETYRGFIVSKDLNFYVGDYGTLLQYNLDTEKEITKMEHKLPDDSSWRPEVMVFNNENTMLFTTDTSSAQVQQWCVHTNHLVDIYNVLENSDDSYINTICLFNDILFVGVSTGAIFAFNTTTGNKIIDNKKIHKDNSWIWDMIVINNILYTVGDDKIVFECILDSEFNITSTNELYKIEGEREYDASKAIFKKYKNNLVIASKSIIFFDLEKKEVSRELLTVDGKCIESFDINDDRIVYSTDSSKYLTSIDLMYLDANKEYISKINGDWNTFIKFIADNLETLKDFRDENDNSFLHYCVAYGNPSIVKYLRKKHAEQFNVFASNKYGESPFSLAFKYGRARELSDWDLSDYTDCDDENKSQRILDINNKNKIIDFLISIAHNDSDVDSYGFSTLKDFISPEQIKEIVFGVTRVIMNRYPNRVEEYITKYCGNINYCNADGLSILHFACIDGNYKMVEKLIERDDIMAGATDIHGNTPLFYAMLLPENATNVPSGGNQDCRFRRIHGLCHNRLICAKLLVTVKSASKRPNVYKKNQKNVTSYDNALRNYDYIAQQMKLKHDEIKDRDVITWSKDQFGLINEVLEELHENFLQSQQRRRRFAGKMFLTEMLHYGIFLVALVSMAFLSTTNNDQSDFYFLKSINDAFISGSYVGSTTVTFDSIVDGNNYFEWLENTFIPSIHINQWYNGDPYSETDLNFVGNYNRFVGGIRMKQIRVKDNECTIAKSMKKNIPFCISESIKEDKTTYGPADIFKYSDDDEESTFQSNFDQQEYSKGGFIIDIQLNDFNETMETISTLKSGRWIDKKTRAIIISFTVYNPNINRLGVTRLVVEFLPSNGAQSYSDINVIKAVRYASSADVAQLVLELFCLVYIAIEFFYREIEEIRSNKTWDNFVDEYLLEGWNYYEWFIIALTITITIFRITNQSVLGLITYDGNGPYINFNTVADSFDNERILLSILVVLCYLRGLKLLRIPPFSGPVVQSVMDTLRSDKVIVFLMLFILIIFSFSLAFSLAFGAEIYGYRTIGASFLTLLRTAFGDFDFEPLAQANYLLGPILFVFFIIFTSLILLNLLVAIMSEVYIAVQGRNETAWERYITKLWIDNVENANAFILTRLIGRVLHDLNIWFQRIKFRLTPSQASSLLKNNKNNNGGAVLRDPLAEEITTTIEYEDHDLDELAEEMREKRINKTTTDIYDQVSKVQTKLETMDPLQKKIDAMEAKINTIEELLRSLVPTKEKIKKKN